MGGSWEGAGGAEAPLWAALLSWVTSPLVQVGMQVSSLQRSLSIFADATALLKRALTPSESAAEMIGAIWALGFTSCQKEQAETLNFRSSDKSFLFATLFAPVLVVYLRLCFA